MREIPDQDLVVYVLWEPILAADDEAAARRAVGLVDDPRAVHYWAPDLTVARAFKPVLGIEEGVAWDVYLVYPPGARWEGEGIPRPASFQHQLGGRLPEASRLDGPRLARQLRHHLAR